MTAPPSPRDDPLVFLRLLWSLDHALQAASKRMLSLYGVTGPQRFAIRFIGRTPGIGAGGLAEALQDHPSTITGILKRLVDRGLVHRRVHPGDRRKVVLTLTEAGRHLETTVVGTVEASMRKALDRLSEDDIRAAYRVGEMLLQVLAEDARSLRPDRKG